PYRLARAVVQTRQVRGEDLLPLRLDRVVVARAVTRLDRGHAGGPRVVHQDVDAIPHLHDVADHHLDLVLVGDVAAERHDPVVARVQLHREGLQVFRVAGGDGDARPFPVAHLGDGTPDAAAAAGEP